MRIRPLWLVSLASILSACTTIPNVTGCKAAGKLSTGMDCAETLTGKTSEMDFIQSIDFIEGVDPTPQDPGHGPAVCFLPADIEKLWKALLHACQSAPCRPEQVAVAKRLLEFSQGPRRLGTQ